MMFWTADLTGLMMRNGYLNLPTEVLRTLVEPLFGYGSMDVEVSTQRVVQKKHFV